MDDGPQHGVQVPQGRQVAGRVEQGGELRLAHPVLAERAPDAQRHGGGLGYLGQLGGGGTGLPGGGGRPVELLGRRTLRQQVEEVPQGGRGVLGGACHAGEHTVIASREGPAGTALPRTAYEAVRRAGGRGISGRAEPSP
ncbi:hypothetical protein GA0115253_105599 [Streptomyces sp. Termitarium-T10T-6]|nr:hypothetical protein GA0115253_105599 [Streptomyces sp. Termitarium-T10T-6]